MESKPQTGKLNILVIDDELGPRESLRIVLEEQYNVILATNGEEGLKRVQENGVDLVVLDIRMPGLNGIDALRKIKETDPRIEVILLTGYGSLSSAQEAVRLGAFDYISKPFGVTEFKGVVKRALERRKANLQEEEYLRQLKVLNAELKKELKESSHLVTTGRITSALLHEIKHPMAGILGYSELLLQEANKRKEAGEKLPDNFEKYVSIIRRETERCGRMSQKFLNFSRLMEKELQETDVNQLLKESLEILYYQAREKRISIVNHFMKNLPRVVCQPDLIKQVFINMALNAIEALPERGKLHISTEVSDGRRWAVPPGSRHPRSVRVVFRDNGPGINNKDKERLFYQGFSTSKTKGSEGHGWGLAVSRQIVMQHQGEIKISSKKGEGTEVVVQLPLKWTPQPRVPVEVNYLF